MPLEAEVLRVYVGPAPADDLVRDGLLEADDRCPETPLSYPVSAVGCSIDDAGCVPRDVGEIALEFLFFGPDNAISVPMAQASLGLAAGGGLHAGRVTGHVGVDGDLTIGTGGVSAR